MKLVKVGLMIVLLMSTMMVFAGERQNAEKKMEEKPYKGEARLRPGQPCIDFSFVDIGGKEVSLKKFKGKYVYIDVWATWCGPCVRETPFLKELEEEMKAKKKKIVFVSMSADSEKNAWERFVKQNEMKGVQLFMGEKGDEFSKFFAITAIPRFILLDKKGNIVDANMSRPSEASTREKLMTLKGI